MLLLLLRTAPVVALAVSGGNLAGVSAGSCSALGAELSDSDSASRALCAS